MYMLNLGKHTTADMKKENGYVLIIGSSNMDLNIYVDHLPNPGETVTGGIFKQFLGGKGANQSVASVRSGARTIFMAKIGNDQFGQRMLDQFIKEGIETKYIIRDSETSSGVAFILIDKNGENMISVAPGANAKLDPQEVRMYKHLLLEASSIVVQMEIPSETIAEIFRIASQGSAIKILNPAPLKLISKDLLKLIDIIIPNEGELFKLHSMLGFISPNNHSNDALIEVSKDLASLGIGTVITTLGSRGCLIYESKYDKATEIPSFKVKAIDTVGAGDCFNGVLASKLSQGETLIEAVKYAIAASSIAVTRKGAQESMPYVQEIEERHKQFKH
jgi:ribokinase